MEKDYVSVVLQEIEECIGQVSEFFGYINGELEECLAKINDEVSNPANLTIDIKRDALKETEDKIVGKLNQIHMLHSQLKSLMCEKCCECFDHLGGEFNFIKFYLLTSL